MNLNNLQVLSLPAMEQDNLSPQLRAFLEELSQPSQSIGLRELLGESYH